MAEGKGAIPEARRPDDFVNIKNVSGETVKFTFDAMAHTIEAGQQETVTRICAERAVQQSFGMVDGKKVSKLEIGERVLIQRCKGGI